MWKANRGKLLLWVGLFFLANSLTVRAGGTRPGHSGGGEQSSEAPHVQVAKALIEGARLDVSLKTDVEMNLRNRMTPKEFDDSLDKVPGIPKDARTLLSDSFKKLFEADESNAMKAFKKALNEVPLVNERPRETAGQDKGAEGEKGGKGGEKAPGAKSEEDKTKELFAKLFEKLKERDEKKGNGDPSIKGDKDKDKDKKDAGAGGGSGGGEGKGDGGGGAPPGGDQGQKGGAPRGAHNEPKRNNPPPQQQPPQESSKKEEKKAEEPKPAPARSKPAEEEEPKPTKKAETPALPPETTDSGDNTLSMAPPAPAARSSMSAIANSGSNPFEAALGNIGGFDGGALSGLAGAVVGSSGAGAGGGMGGGGVESMNMNGEYTGEMGGPGFGETPFRVIEGGYGEGGGGGSETGSPTGQLGDEMSDIIDSVEALLKGKPEKIIVEERASPNGMARGVAHQKKVGPGILKLTGNLVDLTCVKSNEPADEGFDPKAVGLCHTLQKKASLRY